MRYVTTQHRRLHLGYLASIGAALSYGAAALVGRKIVTGYASPMVGTAFSLVFGTLIVVALFHRDALSDFGVASRRAWTHMILAGLTGAWGIAFYFLALNEAPVVLVAPLAGTYPLVAILLTHVFLQRIERVTWHSVLGAFLVVVGVVLFTVGRE